MNNKKRSGWDVALGVGALTYLIYKDHKNNKNIRQQQIANQIKLEELKRESERLRQERLAREKSYSPPPKQDSYEEPIKEEPKKTEVDLVELKKLFRSLSLKYHPDFAQNEIDKKFRGELFIKIKRAYDERNITVLRMYEL